MGRIGVALAVLSLGQIAHAAPLIGGPGDPDHDATLAAKVDDFGRQLHGVMTPPIGWGLEAYVSDPADRALIDAFIASGEDDFEATTGSHVYAVVERYDEMGDLGMFGGVQAAGDAFRYAVLRDSGDAGVDRARDHLLAAMDGLHWYTKVTGVPGVMARGIMRIDPKPGEPPLPGEPFVTVPLFDAAGNPQPADKEPTWRDDNSGELPFLIWFDDTSKDQVDGYIMALGAVYDVVVDDPAIPTAMKERLVADALAIGTRLMEKVEIAPETALDLVLTDADGRPTTFHDLSAEELFPGVPALSPINGFNGWMGMSIMRTLFHITGDEAIGRFYRGLVEERGYLDVTRDTIVAMYTGTDTNFSNVNMAFVAAYGVLRYENDGDIGNAARDILEQQLYATGKDRAPEGIGQSWFDFIYAGFKHGGSALGSGADAVARGIETLRQHPAAPYWDDAVINCDDAEIAALSCTAEDGTPLPLSDETGWNGGLVALDPLPMRLRPPSNFQWRSDPHSVNGGGGTRLNPGGAFYAAYWLGRYLASSADGYANVSPHARDLPAALPEPGAPEMMADDSGCACRHARSTDTARAWWLLALGVLAALRRERGASASARVSVR
jgi:hypothetical protein